MAGACEVWPGHRSARCGAYSNTLALFLTPEQILEIHQSLAARFGGNPLVRDYGLLESAAYAPQETRFGEYINKTLRAQAATYWFSVALNRPFVEGNARTGLAVCEVFLQVNGFQLDMNETQLLDVVRSLANRQITGRDRMLQNVRIRALG